MVFERSAARFAIAGLLLAGLIGCDSDSSSRSKVANPQASAPAPTDHLKIAKQKLLFQDFDAAVKSAQQALLVDPDNVEATLIASQAEAGRGNHQTALELVSAVDLESTLGKDAIEVKTDSLVKLGRLSEAADTLVEGLVVVPDASTWRHRAWELLNRVGRREEASRQAELLCIDGQATQQELLSLIRRAWAFPFVMEEDEDPAEEFASGLGMARWYFTKSEFRKALAELAPQQQDGFESPAACALYGRLLMETQAYEDFIAWHDRCDDRVRQFSDYWAAVGVYFYDQKQYEASARALLESVYRDPTDRDTFQRLFKVFGSLERLDDGQQFRHRGVKISHTEKLAEKVLEAPAERVIKLELARDLADLGRPFEMLQWSKMVLTAANQRERAHLDNQIRALRQDPQAFQMASAVSLSGVAMDDYSVEPAMELLRSAGTSDRAVERAQQVELLARPSLVNVATEVGIDFQWYQDVEINLEMIPIHESLGGGIGVLDFDLDGWPDVYLAQGSGDPPTDQCTRSNVLVRNLMGSFSEVTNQADVADTNYSSGVAAGDVNQDGFPDLWIGSLGHNRLFLNNGDGTFREITDRLKCDDQFTSSLAIGDINGDALPDLFEANYIDMEGGFALPEVGPDGKPKLPGPLSHLSGFDRWFENLGNGEFRTHEIPLEVSEPGTSLGVIVTDFDASGSNQVFVGNDVRPNHFLIHQGEGLVANVADVKGLANGFRGVPNGCMGISAADFSRDGLIDLFITNYYNESNNLYIQDQSGLFTDVAIRYGLSDLSIPMVGFGAKAIDLDRNGWLDLAVTNGHIFDTRIYGKEKFFQMPAQMLMCTGKTFELTEVEDRSGYWSQMHLGRAMTIIDFDRDGAMDLLVGHLDKPVAVLRNETDTPGNGIQFELVGTSCERDAIGARVVVQSQSEAFTQWVTAGDGYLSSDEPVLDFGLGVSDSSVRVEVHWPGGGRQEFADLQPGRRYLLVQGEEAAYERVR